MANCMKKLNLKTPTPIISSSETRDTSDNTNKFPLFCMCLPLNYMILYHYHIVQRCLLYRFSQKKKIYLWLILWFSEFGNYCDVSRMNIDSPTYTQLRDGKLQVLELLYLFSNKKKKKKTVRLKSNITKVNQFTIVVACTINIYVWLCNVFIIVIQRLTILDVTS